MRGFQPTWCQVPVAPAVHHASIIWNVDAQELKVQCPWRAKQENAVRSSFINAKRMSSRMKAPVS